MEANALVMDERSDSNPDNTDSDWEIIKSDVPRHSGLAALATLIQKTPSTRVFRRPQDISLNSPNYQSRYSTQVKENVAPLAGSPDGAVIDARRSAAKSANQGQIGRRQAVPRIPNNSDVAHDGIKYPSLSATKSLPESNLASDNQRRENPENPTSNSTQVENTAEPIDGTQHRNGQEQENHRNKGKPRSNALSSVQVPLSKLERARKLTFATSDTFTAEKIEANSDEKERLREFMNFLTPSKNQHALFKRQLPLFAVTLVSINTRHASRHVLPPGTARTYICIHGSLSDADVSEVHAVLSTKKNRQRYSPWRLCFNQITITPAAASSSSEDGYYRANINSKIQTLCGAQLQIIEPQLSWLSTIGGLVEIDGRYFAITTSHKPGKPSDTDHDSLILDTLHTETLSDVDFDDDVDSAIIIRDGSNAETARIDYSNSENNKVHFNTTKQLRYSEKSPSQEEQVGPSGPQTSWCDIKTSAPTLSGVEWHLIPVKEQYQFPNILIGPNITAKENNHESAKPNPRYALKYSSCLVEADVYVKSGRSGLLKGNLLPSPSFFAIPGHETALEVWIANLEDSKNLQVGDSGSWVFDRRDGTIFGSIIAISPGFGYLIPLCTQFDDIQNGRFKTRPTLPNPDVVYSRLAHYHRVNNPELSRTYDQAFRISAAWPSQGILPTTATTILQNSHSVPELTQPQITRTRFQSFANELLAEFKTFVQCALSRGTKITLAIMVPSMLCSGCLAGYAAGCTFNQFEPILLDESWKSRSLNTPRLGLLIGLVSTAFLLLQVPVGIWLVSRYSTFPEPRIPSSITKYPRVIWKFISGKRYNESFKQSWCRRLFFIVLWYLCGALRYLCCFVLARNTIPGVAKQARASFMVKSTLAIMTLSFSSLMPALQLMWARVFIGCLLKQRHSVVHLKALRYYIVTWVILFLIVTGVAVGLDAASACIIANIAQKLGTFSVSPKSLAATAAVFSAISNLWPFIAFGTLLICPVFLTLAGFT